MWTGSAAENALPARYRATIPEVNLSVAQQQLATLPLDVVPDPAPLPAGSRMLFSRNPLFVGRYADLLAIARAIKGGETAAIGPIGTAAATGMGGIGKTQLAIEFVHRYGQYFAGGVFWLSFADAKVVPTEIAACGGVGYMSLRPDFSSLPLNDQVQAVLAAWQSPLPRLLVFDNCEDEALLAKWRPATGGCYVLVTSRRAHWDTALGVHAHALDVLRRDESVALLRKHRPDATGDDNILADIAGELGDLPLALHLAGNYLARYRHIVTPTGYLAQLRHLIARDGAGFLNHPSLQAGSISPTGHMQQVARTFELSDGKLDASDPIDKLALALLARAAYFAPGEPIPRDLLLATLWQSRTHSTDPIWVEDAIARLAELGLVDMGADGSLRLHRLVAAFVQARTGDQQARIAVEQTLRELADRYNEADDVAAMHTLRKHLSFVTAEALRRADEPAAELCNALGYYLWRAGEYAQAHVYLERALVMRQESPTPEPRQIAESLQLLALVAQAQSQLTQARALFEQSLAIWQQTLGPDHPTTSDDLNNLGFLLMLQGDYPAARSLLRHALAIRRSAYGLRHPETARVLHNLGVLLLRQGRYRAARRHLTLALAIREQVLPPHHIATAQTLIFLGDVALAHGNDTAAWQYQQRAWTMRKHHFDDETDVMAESIQRLGEVLHAQGDLTAARVHLEQAAATLTATIGKENFMTAYALNSLGALLRDQACYSEAQSYLEQAVANWEWSGGSNHPMAVPPLNNLALLFLRQGDLVKARSIAERALEICTEKLGDEHPDTAQSLNILGMLLREEEDYEGARRHFGQALSIFRRSLGPEHPRTRAIQANLDALDTRTEPRNRGVSS
jgi:tetratricopeptide (TPR) repeat protein